MKKHAILIAVIMLLIVVLPAYAHTGVSGRLFDGLPGDGDSDLPWTNGANIYAINCDASGAIIGDEIYATIVVPGEGDAGYDPANAGRFADPWLTDDLLLGGLTSPDGTDYVCLYVQWGAGSVNTPPDTLTAPIRNLLFINSNMSFGNIQSGTGPTAIQLQQIDVTTTNTFLPIGMSLLLLAGISFVLVHRRRQA